MIEQKYALYVEGKDEPIGTLRESTLGAVEGISKKNGKVYRTEPITVERAEEITRNITKLSPNLEKLFPKLIY